MDFEKNDVAVGAFLLAALLAFVGAFVLVNRQRLAARTYTLRIELPEISGIDKGAEVSYKGYAAGQVKKVSVTYEPQFRFVVDFTVNSEIRLPEGSRVAVRAKGFSGGRYLDLIAGKGSGQAIPEGSVLPVDLEADIMTKAHDVLGQTQSVVRRFEEKGVAEEAVALLRDSRLAMADLRRTLNASTQLLEENREALRETLKQTRSMTAKTDELLVKRGPALDRSLQNLDESLKHLPSIVITLEELAADLKARPWRLVRKGDEAAPKLDHKHAEPTSSPRP